MWQLNSNICEYLPDWFLEIVDYQALCKAESEQFELLAEEINQIADNFFFQTMDISAVSQWEKVFDIVPNPATETLAFRQQRIINRISIRPPFTLGFLYQKLDQLIGPGKWTVDIDYPNYTLYIESSSENQQWATEVAYTIGKIKPAHIVYTNKPLTVTGLLIDESVEQAQIVWNYRLGAWGLGINPFASLQSKGVIVVPAVDSIQAALLNDTATFVASDVASARINGIIAITELEKTTNENTAVIQYTVTEEQTAVVTSLELLNAAGEVLTTSPVYVPVTDNVVFKHNLPIKEATA